MQSNFSTHVLPHSDFTTLADNIWQVTGSLKHGHMPRNMVVHKMPSTGGLWIHSCIALNEQRMAALESFGEPEVLVVPNGMHRLDAKVYKDRYPNLKVVCPKAAVQKVEQKLKVDGTSEDVLPPLGVKVLNPDGVKPFELVYELPTNNGAALVFTDLLFNLDHLPGFDGLLMRLIGSTGFFGMTKIGRMLLLRDAAKFSSWLSALASRKDLSLLMVAHGKEISVDVANHLRNAASRLY
jgi:hypothetical protein